MKKYIDKLKRDKCLSFEEYHELISNFNSDILDYAGALARETSLQVFGNRIYLRGLIEFTSYCKNNCLYCGLRRENVHTERYRLTKEQILACCENGYALGFRTFVLQGGEDAYYTDEILADIVSDIKAGYPDCALTLSVGERSRESYERLRKKGADRFLLRHETADEVHYAKLHPKEMSYQNRMDCLRYLKEAGYQTGCGFMVGSPFQTTESIVKDVLFIQQFKPEMIGIGPFLPQKDTPFGTFEKGNEALTLFLISIFRLMFPHALIPATTALGTIDSMGREKGILHGANVLMPNLSPVDVRSKYLLYDHKICTGEEAAECKSCLQRRIQSIGYEISNERGDYKGE